MVDGEVLVLAFDRQIDYSYGTTPPADAEGN